MCSTTSEVGPVTFQFDEKNPKKATYVIAGKKAELSVKFIVANADAQVTTLSSS